MYESYCVFDHSRAEIKLRAFLLLQSTFFAITFLHLLNRTEKNRENCFFRLNFYVVSSQIQFLINCRVSYRNFTDKKLHPRTHSWPFPSKQFSWSSSFRRKKIIIFKKLLEFNYINFWLWPICINFWLWRVRSYKTEDTVNSLYNFTVRICMCWIVIQFQKWAKTIRFKDVNFCSIHRKRTATNTYSVIRTFATYTHKIQLTAYQFWEEKIYCT